MNLYYYLSVISITSCFLLNPNIANADIERGKELHDANCISCHTSMLGGDGTGIYTRENKRIESHSALVKQVQRCRDSLGVPWPEDHVSDVVRYLNESFYKFEE